MMLPLGLGMMAHLDENDTATRAFIMLGIAYSANIGGIGTLVGSPPNIIAAASANITFLQWLVMGMPVVLLLLPCALFILSWMLKPRITSYNVCYTKLCIHYTKLYDRCLVKRNICKRTRSKAKKS